MGTSGRPPRPAGGSSRPWRGSSHRGSWYAPGRSSGRAIEASGPPLPEGETFIRHMPVSASYDNVEGVRMKTIRKTDPNLVALISELKRETREGEAAIWRDIAQRLEKPSRNWAEVNLSRL